MGTSVSADRITIRADLATTISITKDVERMDSIRLKRDSTVFVIFETLRGIVVKQGGQTDIDRSVVGVVVLSEVGAVRCADG